MQASRPIFTYVSWQASSAVYMPKLTTSWPIGSTTFFREASIIPFFAAWLFSFINAMRIVVILS